MAERVSLRSSVPDALTSLCIFTPTGRTYTFKHVRIECDNETVLVFSYSAMSDGLRKTATFPKATLCGWSVCQ